MARPRQVSDEQILAMMRARVLAEGPNVSLEQVAKPLDVSVPALLKRFGSRQALMLAALKPPSDPEWIAHLEKGPDDRPFEEQLLDLFTRISNFMETAIPCFSALRESGIPPSQIFSKFDEPLRGLKAIQKWLAMAKKKGLVSADELDTAAYVLLGSVQTQVFFSHMLNVKISKRQRSQYIEELSRLFTRALKP
jgi:AcrR family transcriptional regulator